MPLQTMTLGLLRVVTRGRDPAATVADNLAPFLHVKDWTTAKANARAWVEATEHETRVLSCGDVLWSGIAPIACAWLEQIPLFAVPYGTSDRNVLRPVAVFIGTSPRYKQHDGLIRYTTIPWAQRWCERQSHRLAMLAKRDEPSREARTIAHVYAPSDAELVADHWRSLPVDSWQFIVLNENRPDLPATVRPARPAHYSN